MSIMKKPLTPNKTIYSELKSRTVLGYDQRQATACKQPLTR
jgi:hypothetical protein